MAQKNYQVKSKAVLTAGLLMFFVFQCLTFAQSRTGRIQGTITDSTTQESLVGANVLIEGTSLGAATDLDGNFLITQVSAGSHKVIVRYIGYVTKEIQINVQENKTIQLDVSLASQVIEGDEIVITAQAQGQKAAINQQLTANTIKNIVSAEKIRQLPDDNAATALSRLPGVSLMNGDQVVIRGVEAKLNQVMVNGIQMPSTGMDDRATNLGFISSNMLAGIEVVKAITPDMDANTIGGVVNLKLREAESGMHFDVLAQGQYNSSDESTNNHKFWASVSNRFFDDRFGIFVQANADGTDGGNQSASIAPAIDASGTLDYGEAVYKTNSASFNYDQSIIKNSGMSVILDYKLPNGKIILQNTYAANWTNQKNNINQIDFVNTDFVTSINRNKFGKDMWINALQAEYTFGDVKAEASLSHSYTDQYTRVAYESGTWTEFSNNSPTAAPFGKNADGSRITYTDGQEQRAMPLTRAYKIYDTVDREDINQATREGWPSAITNTFDQHLYNVSLDVSMPVNFSNNITSVFKTGGKFSRTTRNNNYDRYFSGAADDDTYANVGDFFGTDPSQVRSGSNRLKLTDVMDYNFDRGDNFLSDEYDFQHGFKHVINTDIYDRWLLKSMTGWTPAMKMDDSWRRDFRGSESYAAAYLMTTLNISQKLTLLGGVRYEQYDMNYHANFTYVLHDVYGNAVSTAVDTAPDIPSSVNNVDRSDKNWFPNAQIKYNVNDWLDIRVAYTSGIARPDYFAIVPRTTVFPGSSIEVGNPNLRPTTAQNIDVIASFYSNMIGLFTINGFYKQLEDVQYAAAIYYGNLSLYGENNIAVPDSAFLVSRFGTNAIPKKNNIINTYYNNPNPGYVRGVEIDWQTNFWYLPAPFNSLVFNINYTKSWSDMDYRIIRNNPRTIRVNNKPVIQYVTTDTIYSGRLLQQAGDVINAAIGIDYKGFSGRLSFNMRGDVTNNIGVRPEETSYTGNIYRWDFSIKQNLPVDGLSVSLNGVNIFHNPVKTYRKFRMTADAPITENLISVLYGPTVFQLNVRYSF